MSSHGSEPARRPGVPHISDALERAGVCTGGLLLLADLLQSRLRDETVLDQGRDDHSEEDGASGLHGFHLLGAHSLLLVDRPGRIPFDRSHEVEDTPRLLLSPQLMCEPLPVCHHDGAVQEGLLHVAVQVGGILFSLN